MIIERFLKLGDEIEDLEARINKFDINSLVYKEIFNDFSKPFQQRIDEAAQYALESLRKNNEVKDVFDLFLKTGCILVTS